MGLDTVSLRELELLPGSGLGLAARRGLAVSGMAEFRHEVAGSGWRLPEQDALVVNYAAPSDSSWTGTLDALCRVMVYATSRRPYPAPGASSV